MVDVWLIVLASSSTPYGKVPRLILKKTSRRTQAVVVSEGIFCAARCCVTCYLQSMKVYLHMSNGNVQQNLFMPSILSLSHLAPVLAYDFLSRWKFSPRNPLTRWDVSSIPANGSFLTKKLKTKIKMPNGWRTIKSLVHKVRLHSRRGKGMAESFSREKLRHAPQKEVISTDSAKSTEFGAT